MIQVAGVPDLVQHGGKQPPVRISQVYGVADVRVALNEQHIAGLEYVGQLQLANGINAVVVRQRLIQKLRQPFAEPVENRVHCRKASCVYRARPGARSPDVSAGAGKRLQWGGSRALQPIQQQLSLLLQHRRTDQALFAQHLQKFQASLW